MHQLREANFEKKLNILCHRFSLDEIQLATKNFDDALVIGRGGFGMVYKGFIDNGVCTYAIKRLDPTSHQGAPEFRTEIEMLSKFRHAHIISLIGYCDDNGEMIIVYEYMVHGTLSDHLHKTDRNENYYLSWVQRLRICIGAARGLDYLHTGIGVRHRVIHRDVKSSNILLDENLTAKISDFGLSKIGPANQLFTYVYTIVKGTQGYLDPDYRSKNKLTRKSDVYAFGVVLFEALCGRPAWNGTLDQEQRDLATWAKHCNKEGTLDQIIDPSLRGYILPNCLPVFVKIACQCLDELPKKRPTMADIVGQLEFALALEERRDSSTVEREIFNNDGAGDNEKNADSSMKQQEDINGTGHGDEHFEGLVNASNGQSCIKTANETFPRKVRLFCFGACWLVVSTSILLIVATSALSLFLCVNEISANGDEETNNRLKNIHCDISILLFFGMVAVASMVIKGRRAMLASSSALPVAILGVAYSVILCSEAKRMALIIAKFFRFMIDDKSLV